MEKLIIALAIIGIAAIVMLVKWPGPALGYIYCVLVGLAMAMKFLYPYTSETYEVLHSLTVGGGIGAVFGLIYAVAIRESKANILVIIGCALLLPIVMFITGFVLIIALGFFLMFQNGDGNQVLSSSLIMWGLIAAIVGGGGSIIIVILDN